MVNGTANSVGTIPRPWVLPALLLRRFPACWANKYIVRSEAAAVVLVLVLVLVVTTGFHAAADDDDEEAVGSVCPVRINIPH